MHTDEALLAQLDERDEWIEYLQQRNAQSQAVIAELQRADHELRADRSRTHEQLQVVQRILSSRTWKLARWFHDAAVRIAPPESSRRRLLRFGFRATKAVPRLRRREYVARKVRNLYGNLRDRLGSPEPRPATVEPDAASPASAKTAATDELPSFPRFDRVDVSIVIPTQNDLRRLLACLESIVTAQSNHAYEVIVVDDGSTDRTRRTLRRIGGLVHLRNRQNEGFVHSCNRGASVARGKYLVFLQSDTTVTEGWLDALLATFHFRPDTGLAGAKLVYPDGRLQEAGGVIWRDATGWNYGNGDDPDHPRFNFVREADYCSAACIMVPRRLFHAVGGFDPLYSPEFYEDTDLAFKIRHAGHKVIYQPMARIIHHEERLTPGAPANSAAGSHQLANQAKFRERWVERLGSHPEPPHRPVWIVDAHGQGAENRRAGRVCVIDHRIPYPDRDAGSFRMMEIVRAIRRRNHHVTFVPNDLGVVSPYGEELRKIGVEVIHRPHYGSVADFLEERGALFELVILSRCTIAARHMALVRRLAPQAKIIFDTVDLNFVREERQAEIEGDEHLRATAKSRRRQEVRLALRADLTLVVSPVEKAILEAESALLRVELLPTIFPVDDAAVPPFESRRDIVFIGGFQHRPNVDAVLYFASEVLPRVCDRIPGAVFHVIGPDAPESIAKLASPGITIHGYVADPRPIFDLSRVSVAPLRYGAGVKGKVNQSMAYGVPSIVTSIAAEGMHLVHGENAMIADDPESFGERLVETWTSRDLWQRLSDNGRENIREHFSIETAERKIDAILAWAGLAVEEEAHRGRA